MIIQSTAPDWLAIIPATTGVLFVLGGLYVVIRHVRARWCFHCKKPRERWNHYWFYCPDCREGRWYEDPGVEDAHIDYKNLREPYYYRSECGQDDTEQRFSIDAFEGIPFQVDSLTADTIDVWCDLPENRIALPPYWFLRFEGAHSGNRHPAREDDIDALIPMGADCIDIGKMGDMLAVGFPREERFGSPSSLPLPARAR